MRVYTRSQPARSALRVELHAGRRTTASVIEVSGYNAVIRRVTAGPGTRAAGGGVRVGKARQGSFGVEIEHMIPIHRYSHDDAHLLFSLGREAFTISLPALASEGPIWFAEAGIYIARADDPATFAQYRARTKGCRTVARQVSGMPEQSLAGAMNGQPRSHPIAYCCGGKHVRQKFWVEPCGDIELNGWLVTRTPGCDTAKWKNEEMARFLFGFDRWASEGRHNDPWPVMSHNLQFRRDAVRVQQKCFAVPLTQSILAGEPAPDETMVALVRFRFENTSDSSATAELPVSYSHEARRIHNRREANAYRRDLIRGFETARRHSPLIRLRDGRWIPHYPSRLYCRGRDYGWIRETLEGSVYLLISGLYKPQSKQAGWILDDYLDTRYMNTPFSYVMDDPQTQWFDCGGICPQPALLAGLLPHLDRDEIEVYLWMFFNAWASCYRTEVQAMVEHPQPVLGFGNCAPFKTGDQSNAMKWLAYMFVYARGGLLHLGRAIPRAWFAGEEAFGATRLSAPAGIVSVEYRATRGGQDRGGRRAGAPRQAGAIAAPVPPSGEEAHTLRQDQRPPPPGIRCQKR